MVANHRVNKTAMAKSSRRESKAANRKRLSVERLESRTVLSAANLLVTAIQVAPRFEGRFELNSGPAIIASPFVARDATVRAGAGSRFEQQPRIANRLEKLDRMPSLSLLFEVTEYGTRTADSDNRSEPINRRVSAEAEG